LYFDKLQNNPGPVCSNSLKLYNMKRLLLLTIIVAFVGSCKKKDEAPPSQWSLLVGNWSGFYGDANEQKLATTFTLKNDSSYVVASPSTGGFFNLKGNGKLKLHNNVLHGPITLTDGIQGNGFLVLNVSSDNKQLTGHLSATDNGPSAGMHFIFKKE
jgi:hypothetical protein